ncbi:hypothetical protein FHR88_002453 [Bradyrhizobium betae]|nr:hypothetical protein [Bradyrhizobium betae]
MAQFPIAELMDEMKVCITGFGLPSHSIVPQRVLA